MIKENLLQQIFSILDERIGMADKSIESAKESRDSETKSSVGDKYETGRTLMQMEVEKNRSLRSKTLLLKAELQKIDPNKKYAKVEFGSLVLTTQNNYFISTALGKFELDGVSFFCISLASPIGKLLFNKNEGETFSFQNKSIVITKIQ